MNNTFILKKEHITLLKRAYVDWCDCEFGAPCIEPKRPYGNSDVIKDILYILKVTPALVKRGEKIYSEEQEDMAVQLHKETQIALQIILLGYNKPGQYIKTDQYDTRSWEPLF